MIHIHLFTSMMEMQAKTQSPITVGELHEKFNIPKSTLHRYLQDLLNEGLIMRVKRGQYCISGLYMLSMLADIHKDYDKLHWTRFFESA